MVYSDREYYSCSLKINRVVSQSSYTVRTNPASARANGFHKLGFVHPLKDKK